MKVIKSGEGEHYDAPNHFNMWGVRKIGPSIGAKALNVSVSEFLPNGGATLSPSDKERVYCVLRGSITVSDENGQPYVVDENDMIYIAPGEKRSIAVNGLVAVRLLVMMASHGTGEQP